MFEDLLIFFEELFIMFRGPLTLVTVLLISYLILAVIFG